MSRHAQRERTTKETAIKATINLDGTGAYAISTGIGFLDHMLEQLARHSLIDIDLKAKGDRDRAPYQEWADQDLIEVCPAGIIDEKQVEDHIRELCAAYDVQEIAVDPHLANKLMQNLADDSLPVFQHPQSVMQMSRAIGELVKAVNGDLIRHDGDPVMRSHFDNVAVSTNPQSGLARLHKQRSNGRIDAAVASAMAVSRARIAHEQGGLYDRDDIFDLLNAA